MAMPAPAESKVDIPTPMGMLYHDKLFQSNSLVGLVENPSDVTAASIDPGTELYGLVCAYVSEHSSNAGSFSLRVAGQKGGRCNGGRVTSATLGLGAFSTEFSGRTIVALHEAVGEPVGTDCGPAIMKSLTLVVSGKGNIAALQEFGDELLRKADATDKKSFTVYRWQVQHMYWRRDTTVVARTIDSVVLPKATKDRVVDDLSDFLSEETYEWYVDHGIPYKRAFLFHGAPGAGKTSLIQALAGRFGRNVCYLSPTHPEMTDDNLKSAVQAVPSNSILVLEDIDALFGAKREKKVEKSPLTFSGLLNAIDGVGGATGQIFILTTNHREQLDPALIRNGRVDMHVEFSNADAEQMQRLFSQFYPDADASLASRFSEKLPELLGGETVSMAALQHYFIVMRKKSASEAAEGVEAILAEMEERKQKEKAKAQAAEAADAKNAEEPKAEDKAAAGKAATEQAHAGPAKAHKAVDGAGFEGGIHVHVHVPEKP